VHSSVLEEEEEEEETRREGGPEGKCTHTPACPLPNTDAGGCHSEKLPTVDLWVVVVRTSSQYTHSLLLILL